MCSKENEGSGSFRVFADDCVIEPTTTMSQYPHHHHHYPPPTSGRHSAGAAANPTRHLMMVPPGRGAESPATGAAPPAVHYATGSLDRRRRVSGGPAYPPPLPSATGAAPLRPGLTRTSPGPGIYRTMPLSPQTAVSPSSAPGSRTGTPQQGVPAAPRIIRPVPQRAGIPATPASLGVPRPFSPVVVPKINQSPVRAKTVMNTVQQLASPIQAMSPVPFSPITTLHRYPASPSQFDGGAPLAQTPARPQHFNAPSSSPLPPTATATSTSHPPSSVTTATAEILAQQSQDYVDEQLAEFQNQIFILQGRTLCKICVSVCEPSPSVERFEDLFPLLSRHRVRSQHFPRRDIDLLPRGAERETFLSLSRQSLSFIPVFGVHLASLFPPMATVFLP